MAFGGTFQLKKHSDWSFVEIDLQILCPGVSGRPRDVCGADFFVAEPRSEAHGTKDARHCFVIVNLGLGPSSTYLVTGIVSRAA